MDTQALNSALSLYLSAHPQFFLLLIWSIIWKLIALWKAAKRDNVTIFIVLAVLNTVGIAEIIYIVYLYFKEKKNKNLIQTK